MPHGGRCQGSNFRNRCHCDCRHGKFLSRSMPSVAESKHATKESPTLEIAREGFAFTTSQTALLAALAEP